MLGDYHDNGNNHMLGDDNAVRVSFPYVSYPGKDRGSERGRDCLGLAGMREVCTQQVCVVSCKL